MEVKTVPYKTHENLIFKLMKLIANFWLPIFAPKSGKMQHENHFLIRKNQQNLFNFIKSWVPLGTHTFMWDKGNTWVSSNSQTYMWLFSYVFLHSLHSTPTWHSHPIVTIEGYVWHKCGPDDDEVLHFTSFQALIENF